MTDPTTDHVEPEPVEAPVDAPDAPVDAEPVVDAPAAAPKPKKAQKGADSTDLPDAIRAEAGDSYLSIARRYLPAGRAVGVYAAELVTFNRNRPIREGVKVFLRGN